MKPSQIKELFWVLGTIIITAIIGFIVFGGELFDPMPIDLQFHDTYFVLSKSIFLTIIFISLLITTYLTRGIYFRLNNKVINGILTALLIIVLVGLVFYLNWVNGLEGHLQVLNSREMDQEIQADIVSEFKIAKTILWIMLLITVSLLTTTGYKTIRTHKTD